MILSVFGWTFILAVGVLILVKGADILVDGGGKTAAYLGVPAIVIGLTLVSFGTSLPELASSLNALSKGKQGISVGNVIGSNIANILLVLGVSSLIKPISVDRKLIKRELPIMFGAMILLALFASTFYSSTYAIKRWEGLLLLIAFIAYIGFFVWVAFNEGGEKLTDEMTETEKEEYVNAKKDFDWSPNILKIIGGLVGIAVGSEMMIRSAIFYINEFNMIEGVVGLTIIALATSLPELAASSVAAFKGEADISLGNVIGSNTFNILMVLGICASIIPLDFSAKIFPSFFIMILVSLFLTSIIYAGKKITRPVGAVMLGLYFVYIYYMFTV